LETRIHLSTQRLLLRCNLTKKVKRPGAAGSA
jgi:hypothetical protein